MIARRRRTNSGSESKQNGYQSHQTGAGTYTSNSPTSSPSKSYPEPEMSCRDRTNEFMSAVKLMQSRHVSTCTVIAILMFTDFSTNYYLGTFTWTGIIMGLVDYLCAV